MTTRFLLLSRCLSLFSNPLFQSALVQSCLCFDCLSFSFSSKFYFNFINTFQCLQIFHVIPFRSKNYLFSSFSFNFLFLYLFNSLFSCRIFKFSCLTCFISLCTSSSLFSILLSLSSMLISLPRISLIRRYISSIPQRCNQPPQLSRRRLQSFAIATISYVSGIKVEFLYVRHHPLIEIHF